MYNIGYIFRDDNEYYKVVAFCNENNLAIVELDEDEFGRRFQIKPFPKPNEEDVLTGLRQQRIDECFSIVNRGSLWYNTLTEDQINELNEWYKKWLDVTQTKEIPEKLTWLN
jgi:hypothetical protein